MILDVPLSTTVTAIDLLLLTVLLCLIRGFQISLIILVHLIVRVNACVVVDTLGAEALLLNQRGWVVADFLEHFHLLLTVDLPVVDVVGGLLFLEPP